jgi:hypothetical protein
MDGPGDVRMVEPATGRHSILKPGKADGGKKAAAAARCAGRRMVEKEKSPRTAVHGLQEESEPLAAKR